ncbi:hypothetical protein [Weissella hellenica]|uniref:Uncharacterized protein n=1 Tax=Weissella hellenica TaxID=46256 RepID=A0A4Y4G129_WEIHE|nr:hypothetical protein [Weissella hellenica]NKY67086.1 hypothetical protein [Weissella hellenica]GED36102.1 hypothetical protein WHE01_10060 [Weissella hellenica]SCB95293.1 hypothetical protein GA0061075_10817 [Weissella hellenica]
MAILYTAPSETVTYALLVDDQQGLVSQVYCLQTSALQQQSQIVLPDMMALHTKQTQLVANLNYWLWPIDQRSNQFPSETKTHHQKA